MAESGHQRILDLYVRSFSIVYICIAGGNPTESLLIYHIDLSSSGSNNILKTLYSWSQSSLPFYQDPSFKLNGATYYSVAGNTDPRSFIVFGTSSKYLLGDRGL